MIKGINRQMVVVKLDSSTSFESACFILRRDPKNQSEVGRDILYEANRILAQMDTKRARPHRKSLLRRFVFGLSTLALGMIIGFALSFVI